MSICIFSPVRRAAACLTLLTVLLSCGESATKGIADSTSSTENDATAKDSTSSATDSVVRDVTTDSPASDTSPSEVAPQDTGTDTATTDTGSGGSSGALGSQAAILSTGCGTTSALTFGSEGGESGAACTKYPGGNCSGSQPGYGKGGWLTLKTNDSANGRGFYVRLPDNYDPNKAYPLVFGFHWRGGTAANVDNGGSNGYWWSYYGIQRKSNNSFIFVAPQGINGGWSDGSDLTFVDDMVSLIEKNYCVDTTRLVTMGFSWGSGMSYALSCARAKTFRAAVLYETAVLSGCSADPQGNTNDPIALMMIEGITDGTTPISGAYSMRDRFVQNNGCTPLSSSLDNPGTAAEPPNPPPYLSSGGHICTNYSGCSAGHPLRWCVSQSAHGPGPIDGTADLYNSCATSPGCSASCPCTWTPDDVWSWLTTSEPAGTSFFTPNATQ